jgi:iron complex outermembrane receptor protein
MHRITRCGGLTVIAAAAWFAVAATASAMASGITFQIEGGSGPVALKQFAAQAHIQLLFDYKALARLKTPAVRGTYEVSEALKILLRGTGLTFKQVNDHTIAVMPIGSATTDPESSVQPNQSNAQDTQESRYPRTAAGIYLAQTTSEQTATAAATEKRAEAASQQQPTLQEIIVTATKRAENIQEVPIPITALQSADIEALGIHTGFDLEGYVPGLRVEGTGGLGTPRFNLRGLGTDEYTPNANPSVGFYLDEVYFDSTVAQALQLFDIDQVAVFRGPQGTLWGKNTTAGAISFTTKQPTDDFSAYSNVEIGNYDSRVVEAAIAGPLVGDSLLARVSVDYNYFGGYVRNTLTDTIDNGHSISGARFQLLWKAGDQATIHLTLHDNTLDQVVPTSHGGYLPGGLDANGYGSPEPDRYQVAEDGRGLSTVTSSGGLLKLDWSLPLEWQFVDLLSLERNTWSILDDDDASPFVVSNEGIFSNAQQVSDELRLASPATGPASGIFGLYFLHDTLNFRYPEPQFGVNALSEVTTKDYAAFASGTMKFSDRITGSAGVRYTREDKGIDQSGDYYTPSPIDPYNYALSTTPLVPFLSYSNSQAWSRVTWDSTLKYQVNEDAMVFARAARGFRGGNYNTAISGPNQQGSVAPENLLDYEIGTKFQTPAKGLTIDASVYDYEYSDLQVFLLEDLGATLENAAKARIYGAELEIAMAPDDRWFANISGAYTHARYTSFPDASVPPPLNGGAPADLTGQPLERAPEGTASALLRYTLPVSGGNVAFQTDWYYIGRTIFQPWVDSPSLHPVPALAPYLSTIFDLTSQDPVTIGNARITFTTTNDRLAVALWAKNLTNALYKTNAYNLVFNRNAGIYWNPPLTYGISVTLKFGEQAH